MTISNLSLELAPLLPWPAIAGLGALALVLVLYGLFRRARGTWWRALGFAVLAAALLNTSLIEEQRDYLDDVAVVLVDESPSQGIGDRRAQTDAALEEVRGRIGGLEGIELRVLRAADPAAAGSVEAGEGTRLFSALARGLADLSHRRIAGTIVISDGMIHDVPRDARQLGFDAPLHLLLTGQSDEGDRRLTVTEAPTFGLVDKDVAIKLHVDDLPEPAAGAEATVTVMRDGEPLPPVRMTVGAEQEILLPLEHGGPTVFEIAVAAGPRELSLLNNQAVVVINGVRDRLRVLLVSGEPHAGERTWRNLLKADPSVDLVHFTILRPPEKQDGTPINELSLIAFPIRELFEIKLDEFDLIIFDRYRRRGVLPRAYFENIANYVEQGGALLESAGASYAGPLSLYESPLGRVLPGEPTGEVLQRGFRPGITDIGRRHPVTADLPGGGETPGWGRWFRQVDVTAERGVAVMSGLDGRPLLVLDRYGNGRVAQLLSDQIWLWSRGFEGGGPQAELLRRIAHWLMKEPDLEEEDLRATIVDGRLEVVRRSLEEDPVSVQVTTPGGRTIELPLAESDGGRATGTLAAREPGLYRITDGMRTAFAASGELNPLEFADLRATPDRLQPLVEATHGSITRLIDSGVPEIRKVRAGRDTAGRGWIGLRGNEDYVVTGVDQVPLLPAFLVLLAGLGAVLTAWYREGR